MSRAPGTVFRKTDLGVDELKSRAHGLDPRARQLLILIDGRRSLEELARMCPPDHLDAYLRLLDAGGFIEVTKPSTSWEDTPVAGEDFARHRQRVVRALLDACGPSGDEFAVRIERCETVAELRALLPAAIELAEAISGRAASREFAERVSAFAHDSDANAARL